MTDVYQRRRQDIQVVVSAHTEVAQELQAMLTLFGSAVEEEIGQTWALNGIMVGPGTL
jgi:hypothetical protein